MELLTKELEERFRKVSRDRRDRNPIIITKLIETNGIAEYYMAEYEPHGKYFFGLVSNNVPNKEDCWAGFLLDYSTIKRDETFSECKLNEAVGDENYEKCWKLLEDWEQEQDELQYTEERLDQEDEEMHLKQQREESYDERIETLNAMMWEDYKPNPTRESNCWER